MFDIIPSFEEGNSLSDRVKVAAENLGPELQQVFCNEQFGIATATDAILTDYGKLQAAGGSPTFQINLSNLDKLQPILNAGAGRFVYGHLVPVAYHPYALLVSQLNPFSQMVSRPRRPRIDAGRATPTTIAGNGRTSPRWTERSCPSSTRRPPARSAAARRWPWC